MYYIFLYVLTVFCIRSQKATKNENDKISSCSNTISICKKNVSSRIEQSINMVKEDNILVCKTV